MNILGKLMVALFTAMLLATPALVPLHPAEARAGWTSGGGYSSMGSMGSRTYNYNGGSAINRSMAPQSSPSYGGAYGGGGYGYGGYGGYGGYHPFWSGLAGGLFGGWLGSMMFPHYGMGMGMGMGYGGGYGGGGFGIFSILIWLFLIWGAWRLFRVFTRGGFGGFGGGFGGPGMGFMGGGGYAGPAGPGLGGPGYGPVMAQIDITPSDQTAFEAVLKAVQGAWSKADLSTLRHYVTPEMLSYFSEELSRNNSAGVENHVEDVDLINGDFREAWSEGNLEYATVTLHWRARDWTVRTDGKPGDPGAIVDGDAQHPTEAREMWTFARSPGGHWLLSAIQQV